MQANLTRLTDLTAELRRQLKPLGRQAEVARRAAVIQADLRDARLRLLADDLVTREAELDDTNQAETALRREHDELTDAAGGRRRSSSTPSESAVAGLSERAEAAPGDLVPAVRAGRAVPRDGPLASERAQHLDRRRRPRPPAATPTSWTPRPTRSPSTRRQLLAELAEPATGSTAARDELTERERRSPPRPSARTWRPRAPIADRREGLARLAGQVDACAPASRPSTRPSRG